MVDPLKCTKCGHNWHGLPCLGVTLGYGTSKWNGTQPCQCHSSCENLQDSPSGTATTSDA